MSIRAFRRKRNDASTVRSRAGYRLTDGVGTH
jgi:hypothetical protein